VYRASFRPDMLRCWKVSSGELAFQERLSGISGVASPIATADGRIYLASPTKSYVIKAGPKLEVLAVNDLHDCHDFTSAAISAGRIFIKGKSYLWCIGQK
jgi:hypothetical protein